MAESMFMKVKEVADALEISESYAYKIVHEMNEELKRMGCITIQGRVDRKFFYEKFYGTRSGKEEMHGSL